MNDAEQAVDKVLQGLRDIDTPEGMEGRILLAMRQRAEQPAEVSWWQLGRRVPVRAAVAGGLCAALLCAGLWTARVQRRSPGLVAVKPSVAVNVRQQSAKAVPPSPQTVRASLQWVKAVPLPAMSASDALALDETLAQSQPAPPLPVTRQEQLLSLVSSRHNPEELAALNPEVRARQELQAKVEFRDFFEPVRPVVPDVSPTTVKTTGDTR